MRGQEIHVTARQDHFASLGDFWLFGAVLNEFFSEYTSMNTFTQLKMKDSVSGEQFVWPARIGNRPLL
ncbi:MAG: type VI secretion system baseplate subunit TssF, partial [Desulfobulbaceae bacterium]|nr:type VI secretion system baseplate subunit TssF [Desulfobulbaceae bacterium]